MRYIRTILVAALTAVLSPGCDMTEDARNCPDLENVTLRFSLIDKQGREVFTDNINKTDLYLFDGAGNYHSHRQIPTSNLDADQSFKLWLNPGTYTVVSWGNVGNRTLSTLLSNIHTITDGQEIFNTNESGDPLFYASAQALGLTRSFNPNRELITFIVPENGSAHETIRFTHAHNKLDVYVKGYSINGKLPIIAIEGNQTGFDFYLNYLNNGTVTYKQPSVYKDTDDGRMANAIFNIPRVKEDNNIKIHVINPETGETDWTVTLKEVLESFSNFDMEVEIRIPILFEYFEGRFEVKMPAWETEPTTPGLD